MISDKNLIKRLDKFVDKAFCEYTVDRAIRMLESFENELDPFTYYTLKKLMSQMRNPDDTPSGWGGHGKFGHIYYNGSCQDLANYVKRITGREHLCTSTDKFTRLYKE